MGPPAAAPTRRATNAAAAEVRMTTSLVHEGYIRSPCRTIPGSHDVTPASRPDPPHVRGHRPALRLPEPLPLRQPGPGVEDGDRGGGRRPARGPGAGRLHGDRGPGPGVGAGARPLERGRRDRLLRAHGAPGAG